ncbi:MAG: HD family hydrolase [Pseudomonadota bacterium]
MPASPPPAARAARQPSGRAWQRMLSGRRLDLLDPSPLDIEVEDIAHGLSRVARWNGQTTGDYTFSVAQHSLLVEELTLLNKRRPSPAERLFALLHDAPEYVVGDLISPFKAVVGDGYKALEKRLLDAILTRFSLPAPPPASWEKRIKRADKLAAYLEAVQLAGFTPGEAKPFFGSPKQEQIAHITLKAAPPEEAKRDYLTRFQSLMLKIEPSNG